VYRHIGLACYDGGESKRTEATNVEDLTLFVRVLVARDDVRGAVGFADDAMIEGSRAREYCP